LRAAWWTLRAARTARRQLDEGGLEALRLPTPPKLPASAERGVTGVLVRRKDTCLVRTAVRQAWKAAQGDSRDLVIGVTTPSDGFEAHAWLDGDSDRQTQGFKELTRVPVRR
jgi:hypothetical protein